METTLRIHSIESFGTHDGPGIRLVLFLQGCNMKCLYCQNADTIKPQGGTEYTIDELVQRAIRMKGYFGKTGGVTASGGEPLLQSKALIELFKALQAEGIHTNIDTNSSIKSVESIELIENLSDLVMFDIKQIDPEAYNLLTGIKTFATTKELITLREQSKKPYWLRYVLVPGYTDNPEHLKRIGETYGKNQYVERFQILPYHKLGEYKWEVLGEQYKLEETPENTEEQIDTAKNILRQYFGDKLV